MASRFLKIALLQTPSFASVPLTVDLVFKTLRETIQNNKGIQLVVLPECFTCIYDPDTVSDCAETIPDGNTSKLLSKAAKEFGVYIVAGTMWETDAKKKLYNTCTVWSPKGELIAKHRKSHLFDIDIESEEGGVTFQESAFVTPGNDVTVVEIEGHKVGIAICHEMRFEELARCLRKKGCEMIIYPALFCTCQGPMHWELLQRSRANDNQLYVVSVGGARDTSTHYVAYGHSMIVDPWGRVVKELGAESGVIVYDIDFDLVAEVRRQIPIFKQRRTDLYDTICKK